MEVKHEVESRFKDLQKDICTGLERVDQGAKFQSDSWTRTGGGGGLTRIFSNGKVIEKGGVNFSAVFGDTPEKIASALGFGASVFYATGVSIVLHPHNPFMPIIHMNIRYFEMEPKDGGEKTYWFGGGIDLTPHYIFPEDAAYFHHQIKDVCDGVNPGFYPRFKQWADDYFFVKHRNETRGIGGIFFDRINEEQENIPFESLWTFVQNVGHSFVPIYEHYAKKYADRLFDDSHKKWQMLRRGRYVEFNLVWDKGTKFGLETDGRTESILMSLPSQAMWEYDYKPEAGSDEEKTLHLLKKDIDWISHA